jgi:DNA-binding transcriptional ArsR family regulator
MANRTAHAFDMLADPTRRAILERIGQSPAAVGEIASGLPVSRPAVSQHLKLLKEAGLVTETAAGTRRIYRIDPRGLGAMRDWLDQFWKTSLDNFAAYAEAQAREEQE